jgi:tetratricopeptide (TPR) repeat protein
MSTGTAGSMSSGAEATAPAAIDDCTRIIAARPDSAQAFSNRATARFSLSQLAAALADYNSALTLRPAHHPDHESRCSVRFAQNDYAGAPPDCSEAIRLAPGIPAYYTQRGLIHR